MSDLPWLPGCIPGLLRHCSPVLHRGLGANPHGHTGVLVRLDATGDLGADALHLAHFPNRYYNDRHVEAVRGDRLALDLADATGRTHAAAWLAQQPEALWRWDGIEYGWTLYRSGRDPSTPPVLETWHGRMPALRNVQVCPALHELDQLDPTLLPDGTRRVDAEALRLVCLHVAAERGWAP